VKAEGNYHEGCASALKGDLWLNKDARTAERLENERSVLFVMELDEKLLRLGSGMSHAHAVFRLDTS